MQKLADQFDVGRLPADLALGLVGGSHAGPLLTLEEQARIASVLKEQAVAAEIKRKQLADELIAEEEEEARRREKRKAKNKGKKPRSSARRRRQRRGAGG